MKKLIFCALALVFTSTVYAQAPKGKVAEGTLVYNVTWQLPEQMKPMAASFPTELTVYFKGDSSSMKMASPMYTSNSIMNVAKDYDRLLLDIPVMGKKYSVVFTPEDQDKMLEAMPDFAIKPTAETKTVAGLNAIKHEVLEKKSNKSSEAWFSKDVDIIHNSLTRFYNKSFGFPVEFSSFMTGLGITATLKEIKAGPVPAGSFTATKDYEEITMQQLMQMQGGRR